MKMLPGEKSTSPHKIQGWRGYTYDQLLYRRAYVTARLELEREQLLQDIQTQRQALTPMGILGYVGNAFKYANWGVLAFQAFRTIGSLFSRKKK